MKKLFCLSGVFALAMAVCARGDMLDVTHFNRVCQFTVSGYHGGSTLGNFPILLRLSTAISGFSYSECAAGGADLRFTDAAGNLLAHEIETWDTAGESAVWVKVPALSGTTTVVRMYYGVSNVSVLPAVTPSDVWSRYITVIHGGSGLTDSSPQNLAIMDGGGVSATADSGIIGGGVTKPVQNTIGVNVPNPVKNAILTDVTRFSFSAWYRTSTGGGKTAIIAASKGTWGGTGYLLICEGGSYMSVAVQSAHQGTGGKGALVNNTWAHVGFSYIASGNVNTYFNGESIYSNAAAKSLGDEDKDYWSVGSYAMTTHGSNFIGDMDEIRIYDGIASADWFKAEHDSMAADDFVVAGAVAENVATWGSEAAFESVTQTAEGAEVTGTITRFATGATSVTVALKWGETTTLEGGSVEVGGFTAPGTIKAVFPGQTAGKTYYFAFVMTSDTDDVSVSETYAYLCPGEGALWRPQSVADTWDTTSWLVGSQMSNFVDGWPIVFDGQEQIRVDEVAVPTAVHTTRMTVSGDQDYKFTGTGPITAAKVVKTGSGTMNPGTLFTDPVDIEVLSGVMKYEEVIRYGRTIDVEPSKLTVGGTGNEALVELANSETFFGFGDGGKMEVNVLTNGTILVVRNSVWVRFGAGEGCTCDLYVAPGGYIESGMILMGSQAAVCNARVAGTILVRNYPLGVGEASETTLVLEPGGRIKARGTQMWNNSASWSGRTGLAKLHVRGGTLELYPVQTYDANTPILNTVLPVTYEDSITFEIPTGGSSYMKAALTNVTEGATAHFVKTGGGDLIVSGPLDGISGAIDVLEGRLTFTNKFADDADVVINVAEDAVVSCDVSGGGAKDLLKFIDKNSRGTLMLHGYDGTSTIDLSEYPNLKLAIWDGGTGFSGTLIPYGNHLVLDMYGKTGILKASMTDANGVPARITVTDTVGGGVLDLAGDNSGMSGGIVASGNVRLRLSHAQAAGTGNVSLDEGVAIEVAAALGAHFLQTRVTADSRPAFIFISPGGEACNVDLSRFPGCRLGTIGATASVTHTGTVTPCDGEFTLGGGNTPYASSYSGLKPGILADGATATKVVVDQKGTINLSNSDNTYSGGTVVTNAGQVFFAATDGFGAVPETFDAKNIFVDGGVLRHGNANTTLNANRGIWVGEGGMTFHPWGSYTLNVPGGLGGNGKITFTDGGHLTLSGSHNTYDGAIEVKNASTVFTIGSANAFSWASAGGISSVGTVALNTPEDVTFGDVVSGSGAFKKQGEGTLSFSQAQLFSGATSVEAGTLHLTAPKQITSTSSIYNKSDIFVDFAGSATDAFGKAPIYGPGTIRFAGGNDTTIDRMLGGTAELSAEDGATLDCKVVTTAAISVDNASLALTGTGAGTVVEGFADFKLNGSVTMIDENEIQLSEATTYKGGTAFWRKRVNVTRPWQAHFTYKTVNPPASPADGFAFFLHNSENGLDAIGATGGSICASGIIPSVGVAYNIYNTDSAGWINDGGKTSMSTALNGISVQDGMNVWVTYDGEGKMIQSILSGNKYVAFTNSVNLLEKLGSSTAWMGFSGATGGAYCDQRITDFRFYQADASVGLPNLDVANDSAKWQLNRHAVYEPIGDIPAFRLTDASNYNTGVVTRLERIYVGAPFRISGTYHYTSDNSSGNPADGAAVFLHVNRPTDIAAGGGSCGIIGLGINGETLSTAIGWIFRVNSTAAVIPVKNATAGTAVTALNGVNPKNKSPMDFVLSYTPGLLEITVKQGENSATLSQEVDLAQYFGNAFAYFSVSGGTGGRNAKQYFYGFKMEGEYSGNGVYGGYGDVTFSGTDALRVAAGANDMTAIENVTFAGDATVGVSASGAENAPYTVRINCVNFDVADDSAAPAINLAANGAGSGTLQLGTLTYGENKSPLKISGAVSGIDGGKIKVVIPLITGVVPLLDLTEATGVSLEDFELVTDTPPPVELRFTDGILKAACLNGTLFILY